MHTQVGTGGMKSVSHTQAATDLNRRPKTSWINKIDDLCAFRRFKTSKRRARAGSERMHENRVRTDKQIRKLILFGAVISEDSRTIAILALEALSLAVAQRC